MNPLQLAGLSAALGAPFPAHRCPCSRWPCTQHPLLRVHRTTQWPHRLEHRSCALKGSFSPSQVTWQTRSTDVGGISSSLWGQAVEGWSGAHKPQGSKYELSQSTGQAAQNKILSFFLKILSPGNQTQPENPQRSICESKMLNKVAAKPLTKPNTELPYTDSIVFSTSRIEGEEILFPQRQRVCLQTRQGSWAWAQPTFASALRWSYI